MNKPYFTNGHFEEKDIIRYIGLRNLDGENKGFANSFQNHLCECAECRKLYELYEKLVDTVSFTNAEKSRKNKIREFILAGENESARSAREELQTLEEAHGYEVGIER